MAITIICGMAKNIQIKHETHITTIVNKIQYQKFLQTVNKAKDILYSLSRCVLIRLLMPEQTVQYRERY